VDGVSPSHRDTHLRNAPFDPGRLLGREGRAARTEFSLDLRLVMDLVASAEIHLESVSFAAQLSGPAAARLVFVRRRAFRISRATLFRMATPII
jgi:predicted RNA-binding protein YlqC (UPF0109 family)